MNWNTPMHRGTGTTSASSAMPPRMRATPLQNARTARTVAQHATDAEDCRLLLDMLGLRLDGLRAEKPTVL